MNPYPEQTHFTQQTQQQYVDAESGGRTTSSNAGCGRFNCFDWCGGGGRNTRSAQQTSDYGGQRMSFGSRQKLNELRSPWVNIWTLVFLPPIGCTIILLFSLIGPFCGGVAQWLPFVLLFLGCAFFTFLMYKRRYTMEVTLGGLCLVGLIAGISVSGRASTRWLNEYYRITQGASYSQIWPSAPALSMADGTTFMFTNETKVDSSRTYGWLDSYSLEGTVYCVAPVSADPAQDLSIQFWVAGTNCCQARSSFACGGSTNPNARGAVRVPGTYPQEFHKAVEGAETAYDLTPNNDFILLSWHEDPIKWTGNLWHSVQTLYLAFTGGYVFLSWVVGLILDRSFKS